MSAVHAAEFTPARLQKGIKVLQHTYPIRIKAMHIYNNPKVFDMVYPVAKQLMGDKLRKRMIIHGSDLKSLHKHIPKNILPKEYGGELESLTTINEKWVEHLVANEKILLNYQNHGIDLEKAKQKNKSDAASSSVATDSVVGTFRKLNVD